MKCNKAIHCNHLPCAEFTQMGGNTPNKPPTVSGMPSDIYYTRHLEICQTKKNTTTQTYTLYNSKQSNCPHIRRAFPVRCILFRHIDPRKVFSQMKCSSFAQNETGFFVISDKKSGFQLTFSAPHATIK